MDINPDTIPKLDVNRYSGLWNEVMKLPFKWEVGCVASTAEYYKIYDNEISIVNTCYLDNNNKYSRRGIAKVLYKEDPGKLRVEFNDGLPSDYVDPEMTNYWIHYLDYDKYAVVGTPTGEQVWLLGRSTKITKEDLDYFIRYIGILGYDNSQLKVQQNIVVTK